MVASIFFRHQQHPTLFSQDEYHAVPDVEYDAEKLFQTCSDSCLSSLPSMHQAECSSHSIRWIHDATGMIAALRLF